MQEHYKNRHYAKSLNLTRMLTAAYDGALSKFDVLVLPTVRFKSPLLPAADLPVAGNIT